MQQTPRYVFCVYLRRESKKNTSDLLLGSSPRHVHRVLLVSDETKVIDGWCADGGTMPDGPTKSVRRLSITVSGITPTEVSIRLSRRENK